MKEEKSAKQATEKSALFGAFFVFNWKFMEYKFLVMKNQQKNWKNNRKHIENNKWL